MPVGLRDPFMSFFHELKRRNVLRVGTAYAVSAWLLIQVAETIFPLFGFGDTPARMMVILLAIGFVPTLVLSWVFEITPQGVKKDADVVRDDSTTRTSGKKLDRIILIVLTLALAYFAFDKFVLDPARDAELVQETTKQARTDALVESYGDKSLAVLPFQNMSGDPEQEFFSDGVSAELLILLSRVKQIRITPRTSSFYFKGKDVAIEEIAKTLNVDHILDGSVRKDGNRVRITVDLIDPLSNTLLWSESYDRQLEDIFTIQNEVAEAVVAQLEIQLLGDVPTASKTDSETYMLYLQADHIYKEGTADALIRSADLYERAVKIDPGFVAAWVRLAESSSYLWALWIDKSEERRQLIFDALDRADEIDPDNAEVLVVRGGMEAAFNVDFESAAQHMMDALAHEAANPFVLEKAANLLWWFGRLDDAIEVFGYLIHQDPVNSRLHADLGELHLGSGHFDQAISAFERSLVLSPENQQANYLIARAFVLKGEPDKALEILQKSPDELRGVFGVTINHALGRSEASDAALARMIEPNEPAFAWWIAQALAFRGEVDRALEFLTISYERNNVFGLGLILSQPEFEILHDDPRWMPFLERLGLSPAQLEKIDFEVTVPE
jgi:TolB-like protein/thioredoxin-like negative regulator of GroEL